MSKKIKSSDWRDLKKSPQKKGTRRKPISWRARFRSIWNWTKAIFIIGAIVTLCVGAIYAYKNFYFNDIFESEGVPISRVELKTDGKINGNWISSYLKIKRGSKLSDINIFEVKHSLDSLSQIKSSKVERIYPDVLRITISEHRAIAKMILRVDYENRLFAISPEGIFFVPTCLPQDELESLKLLVGFTPNFDGSLPAPLKSIKKVTEFLSVAQTHAPNEYAKWRSLDISQIESITLPLIKVKDDSIEYIFKVGEYPKQFDRLDYILRYMKENPIESVEKIDLTLTEWSVVKFSKPQKK